MDALERLLRNARPVVPSRLRSVVSGATLADGRIRVLKRLGGGATGTVYEALDRGQRVALKILNDLNPHQIYRLKQEFRLLVDLRHSNVVSMYELFGSETDWFFTMELVPGRPLDLYWLQRECECGSLDTHERSSSLAVPSLMLLRMLFRQLVEGVAAVHQAGLLHRDLKPSNVLIEPGGRLVIVDFGLVSDQLPGGIGQTVEHAISGTPAYMAPEQARGERATKASDLYAVGAILYQLLCNKLPHTGDNTAELIRRKQSEALILPSALNPDVPPDLDRLCESLLQRDQVARPSTSELLKFVRSWSEVAVEEVRGARYEPPLREQPFVGRDEILPALELEFREQASQSPSVVLIDGTSGIGKSTLLRRVARHFRQVDDALVLEGHCYYGENVPYKAFDGVMDHLSRILRRLPAEQSAQLVPRHLLALLRLFPVLRRVEIFGQAASRLSESLEGELSREGPGAVRELLCRVADRRRLVVIIDDLHWGDADSIRLLAHVCSAPNAPRMLIVASYRVEPDRCDALLHDLLAIPKLRLLRLQLSALNQPETTSLVLDTLGSDDERTQLIATQIARESAGIPVYAMELAQCYLAGQLGARIPSLTEMLHRRVNQLSSAARTLLSLVTIAGRPLRRLVLASLCGEPLVSEVVDEMRAARLVRMVSANADFAIDLYHDRVNQAVSMLIQEPERTSLHGMLANALETTETAGSEELAVHWRAAAQLDRAAEHALKAAEQAADALACHRAADLYKLAIELGRNDDTVLVKYAAALSNSGRNAAAADMFLELARDAPRREQLRYEANAASEWLRSGHPNQQAVEVLRSVLQRAGVPWPSSILLLVLSVVWNRLRIRFSRLQFVIRRGAQVPAPLLEKLDAIYPAQTAFGTFDYLRGAYFSSLALPLALKAGEPDRLVTALASEAVYRAMLHGQRRLDKQRQVQSRLEELAATSDGACGRAGAALASCLAAYWRGSWQNVVEPARQADHDFRSNMRPRGWELTLVRSVRNTVFVQSGRFSELAHELPPLIAESRARNDMYTYLDLTRTLISVRLAHDETAEALSELEELTTRVRAQPFVSLHPLLMATTVSVRLYTGEAAVAAAQLEEMWTQCRRHGLHRFPLLRAMNLCMQADCVWADQSLSVRERVEGLTRLSRKLAREPIAWAGPAANGIRARVHQLTGADSSERLVLARAIRGYRACGKLLAAELANLRICTLLDVGEGETLRGETRAALQRFEIANPERWQSMVGSMY